MKNLFNKHGDEAKEHGAEIYEEEVDVLLHGLDLESELVELDEPGGRDVKNMVTGTSLAKNCILPNVISINICDADLDKVRQDPLVVVNDRCNVFQVLLHIILAANIF